MDYLGASPSDSQNLWLRIHRCHPYTCEWSGLIAPKHEQRHWSLTIGALPHGNSTVEALDNPFFRKLFLLPLKLFIPQGEAVQVRA